MAGPNRMWKTRRFAKSISCRTDCPLLLPRDQCHPNIMNPQEYCIRTGAMPETTMEARMALDEMNRKMKFGIPDGFVDEALESAGLQSKRVAPPQVQVSYSNNRGLCSSVAPGTNIAPRPVSQNSSAVQQQPRAIQGSTVVGRSIPQPLRSGQLTMPTRTSGYSPARPASSVLLNSAMMAGRVA